jgi:murein L,D-transpeptidase YcbB/YkuD
VLGVALAACKPAPEPRTPAKASPGTAGSAALPAEPAGPPDPDVAATVARVIGSAHHPQLRWPDIPDVAPTLKLLYDAEPDGLFWFAGRAPYPGLAGAVAGLALADEHGLDHADYDARALAESWAGVRDGTQAAPAQRALLDLGLTASVARLLSAVHVGRVDPATLRWGYDITPKTLDRAAILRELRRGGDLQHVLAYLEPPFAHYARARHALARYKAAAAQRAAPVPALRRPAEGRTGEAVERAGRGSRRASRHSAISRTARAAPRLERRASDLPLVDAVGLQARHGSRRTR